MAAAGRVTSVQEPIDYLTPRLPPGLARVLMPIVEATPSALEGYGCLIDDPNERRVEFVRWPAAGRRPGRNEAVGGHYILAYAQPPESAREDHTDSPRRMMLWHANYHPDGGQLFSPLERRPFYVPLALPGDDVTPQKFVCFRFSGQGAVHARVSVDFAREFGCLLEAAIPSAP